MFHHGTSSDCIYRGVSSACGRCSRWLFLKNVIGDKIGMFFGTVGFLVLGTLVKGQNRLCAGTSFGFFVVTFLMMHCFLGLNGLDLVKRVLPLPPHRRVSLPPTSRYTWPVEGEAGNSLFHVAQSLHLAALNQTAHLNRDNNPALLWQRKTRSFFEESISRGFNERRQSFFVSWRLVMHLLLL